MIIPLSETTKWQSNVFVMISGQNWSEKRDEHEKLFHITVTRMIQAGMDVADGGAIPVIDREGIHGYAITSVIREECKHRDESVIQRNAKSAAWRISWSVVLSSIQPGDAAWPGIRKTINRWPHLTNREKMFSPVWEKSKSLIDSVR